MEAVLAQAAPEVVFQEVDVVLVEVLLDHLVLEVHKLLDQVLLWHLLGSLIKDPIRQLQVILNNEDQEWVVCSQVGWHSAQVQLLLIRQ